MIKQVQKDIIDIVDGGSLSKLAIEIRLKNWGRLSPSPDAGKWGVYVPRKNENAT